VRAVIVNCFFSNDERVNMLYNYFTSRECETYVVTSDFNHLYKNKRTEQKNNYYYIETKPYYQNISFKRLFSHYFFAKNALNMVERLNPDILYIVFPPNSLPYFAAKYKKEHIDVKLIFDIIDLWPESIPILGNKNFFPFNFWRKFRDNNLSFADIVITECGLYQEVLEKFLNKQKSHILYLAREDSKIEISNDFDCKKLSFCYLGSINNIIGIKVIADLIKKTSALKPVDIHIIGDGENRDLLIHEAKNSGASVFYYGKIFDDARKHDIFNKCTFGLNIMKENVRIGLTTKSIDYFEAGLPIINNIKGDTEKLVDEYAVGLNLTEIGLDNVVKEIVSMDEKELLLMRRNTKNMFCTLFSVEAFNRNLDGIFKYILPAGL